MFGGRPRIECAIMGALYRARRALSGAEISRAARVSAGSLYPALSRLEVGGELISAWESEPVKAGAPRRRLYQLAGGAR